MFNFSSFFLFITIFLISSKFVFFLFKVLLSFSFIITIFSLIFNGSETSFFFNFNISLRYLFEIDFEFTQPIDPPCSEEIELLKSFAVFSKPFSSIFFFTSFNFFSSQLSKTISDKLNSSISLVFLICFSISDLISS